MSNELFKERIQLLRDTQAFKKTNRVPLSANVVTWMFHDAGYSTAVAARDHKIIAECACRFAERYPVDQLNWSMSAYRNCFQLTDCLGTNFYSEGGNALNIVAEDIFTPADYSWLKDASLEDIVSRIFYRKYPQAAKFTPEKMAECTKTFVEYLEARGKLDSELREKYGLPMDSNLIFTRCFVEVLFQSARGIKGLSMDLRRHWKEVRECCEAWDERFAQEAVAAIQAKPYGWDMNEPYDVQIALLAHTVLNRKQFDVLMAPLLEKTINACAENGKQMAIFCEGAWARFGDFFNQFPKGTITMMVEDDDIFECRKKFPNIALYGGIDVGVLGNGTKQECIDMCKKVIDEVGADGGLILAPNKMLSYPKDCKSENLEAICDFVHNYRV